MKVESFFHQDTFTLTYIVFNEETRDAVIIDPVMDFDYSAGKISRSHHEKVKAFILDNKLNLHYILETHVHADHITGAPFMVEDFSNVKTVISDEIRLVQKTFKPIFNLKDIKDDGSQFDILVKEGDQIKAGAIEINVIATPGHTPACITYQIEDCLFTGDAMFMPDFGTGRCDFPNGDARELYQSIQKLYQFDDSTKVYVGHDYAPGGREYAWQTTIGDQKKNNIQLKSETSEEEFVSFRTQRDAGLNAPKLLLPSIQINMNGGKLPVREDNGVAYLKIPLS